MNDPTLEVWWSGGELLPPRDERISPMFAHRSTDAHYRQTWNATRRLRRKEAGQSEPTKRRDLRECCFSDLLVAGLPVSAAAQRVGVGLSAAYDWAAKAEARGIQVTHPKAGRKRRTVAA